MSSNNVADCLLERLRDRGVDHVFAFPGDGINGILAAWTRAEDNPTLGQSRHTLDPTAGTISPDPDAPGNGLALRSADVAAYEVAW